MIHHVYANRSNIGDWLAAKGIQSLLGRPVVEHLCDDPFIPVTLDSLSRVDEGDLVVIGGGGLFMDYFEPFWTGLLDLEPRPRYCIWGAGLVDIKREESRLDDAVLGAAVAGSQLTVVRDEMTRRATAAHGPVSVVACPSLVAVEHDPPLGRGVLHAVNHTTVGAAEYEAMRRIGMRFAAASGRPFAETNNRIDGGDARALHATLDRYRQSDIVISSALHGCIVAVAMKRRLIAVSGDRKIEEFMAQAGLGEWVLSQGEVDVLAPRLEAITAQDLPPTFVPRAQQGNREVAAEVIQLHDRAGAA